MKCRSWIWEGADEYFNDSTIEVVDYPREVTSQATISKEIANWVEDTYFSSCQYDIVVGHSMGGVVALHLANNNQNLISKVILVESFLMPSMDFYHNLLYGNEHLSAKTRIEKMMHNEKPYYTDALTQELRTGDYSNLALHRINNLVLLYGDRGCEDIQARIDALNLPLAIVEKVRIEFIRNASHFPMLENKQGFYSVISNLVKQE